MSRSDKGSVLATPRDLVFLPYVAHHTVVRVDHLRELLSKLPGAPVHDIASGLLAESTVTGQIDRWRRAGWINSARVLAGQPSYLWVTKFGLHMFGLDELYKKPGPPSLLRFWHYRCVLDVRLNWWDDDDPEARGQWIPERRLRAEAMWQKHLPEGHEIAKIRLERGSIPDAVMAGKDFCDAIEVQLSPLKPAEMKNKVDKILQASYRDVETDREYIYNDVHFYVPSEALRRHVETACVHLSEENKKRVDVIVDPDYMPVRVNVLHKQGSH